MNNNPLNPKQERKRKKIISVAFKLFVKHGIQGTSMQLLAKRADISTGSIYNYFVSKDTLITELYKKTVEEENEYTLVDYDENAPIFERFEHLVRHTVLYRIAEQDQFLFRQQYMHTPDVMDDMHGKTYIAEHPFAKLIFDAQHQGICKPFAFQDILYSFASGLSSFVSWKLFREKDVTENDIKNLVELMWDSLVIRQEAT